MTPERYKELADAAVRVGVGTYVDPVTGIKRKRPLMPGHRELGRPVSYEAFITDWRVVGALMEKVQAVFIEALSGTEDRVDVWAVRADKAYGQRTRSWAAPLAAEWVENESMPLAIAEACLKALGEIE